MTERACHAEGLFLGYTPEARKAMKTVIRAERPVLRAPRHRTPENHAQIESGYCMSSSEQRRLQKVTGIGSRRQVAAMIPLVIPSLIWQ